MNSQLFISNLQAFNLGNGKTVELSWSVPDISKVKYFTVEYMNRHTKKWVPYDGFHGTIFAKSGEQYPPQKVVFDVDYENQSVTFRVKAASLFGGESEWANTSCVVKVMGSEFAETTTYFVKEGLEVSHTFGFNIKIDVGVAYLGGFRRFITRELSLRLPDGYNVQYVIYIDINGIVGFVEGLKTPSQAIRLADVFIDSSGSVSVVDKRFLWAPENISVSYDPQSARLSYLVDWDEYSELNLYAWKIYRAEGFTEPSHDNFKPITVIEKGSSSYDDTYGVKRGVRYWYKISALDWGNNESPLSSSVSVEGEQYSGDTPSIPTGLTGYSVGTLNQVNIVLNWDANPPEEKIQGYYPWFKLDGDQYFQRAGTAYDGETTYTHRGLIKGAKYWYAVSAYNALGAESERCEPIEVIAGDTMPPAAPEWALDVPISTGMIEEEYAWIKLKWREVTTNQDGSGPISPGDDLHSYRIHSVIGEEIYPAVVIPAESGRTEHFMGKEGFLWPGAEYTFVLTAVDTWGNESLYSESKTIIAGGPKPKPPVLEIAEPVGNTGAKITFSRVAEDTDGNPIDIKEYIVYRGFHQEVGRVDADSSQSDTYEFEDNGLSRGRFYTYKAKAVAVSGRTSEYSNELELQIGDFTPPTIPTWVSLETRINPDYTIDNILVFECGQEEDLHGVYIYARRADVGEHWDIIGLTPKQDSNPYTYTHTGLVNGGLYKYNLKSFDTVGNISLASEVREQIAGTKYPPMPPEVEASGFYNYDTNQAYILFTWPEVALNDDPGLTPVTALKGYKIYKLGEVGYQLIADVPSQGLEIYEYADTEVLNSGTYSYKAVAYNAFGMESRSCVLDDIMAGDNTPPARPQVDLAPTFSSSSPSSATIELRISSMDTPSHYKIYLSSNGLVWNLAGTVEYSETGATYRYEIPYGYTTYFRVSAVSVPGVEGSYQEGSYRALDTTVPENIPPPSVTFEQDPDGSFSANITWVYNPPEDFKEYQVLFDQENPVVLAVINDRDTKLHKSSGFRPGITYSFAAVCQDLYGLKSTPLWSIDTPIDLTIPKAPQKLVASGGLYSVVASWDPVTRNEDESNCTDLSHYIIEMSKDDNFNEIFDAKEVSSLSYSYTFNTMDVESVWYFRIKSRDYYGNESTTWAISGGAKAEGVEEFMGGAVPTEAPVWSEAQPNPFTGIEYAKDNDGSEIKDKPENTWIKFQWNPVLNASSYNIYISSDNNYFYLLGSSKSTSRRVDNLLLNTTYYIKVSGVSKLGEEGPPSFVKQITTSRVVRTIPAPSNFSVATGKNLLASRWDYVSILGVQLRDLSYTLETRSTSDPSGSPSRSWGSWVTIYNGKGTSFIHSPLEYNKFYQYRVSAKDSSGNVSDYNVNYATKEWSPEKTGSEDLAVLSIQTQHLTSWAIVSDHISSNAIETRHLQADCITAEKIIAGAVRSQHLTVSLGGYNYLENSGFGMRNFEGDLGVGWQVSNATIEAISDAPVNTDYCVYMSRISPASPYMKISQTLTLDPLKGKEIIVSHYNKRENLTGADCKVRLAVLKSADTTPVYEYFGPTPNISGTSEWRRSSFSCTIPEDAIEVRLEALMERNAIGEIWFTGFKVEDGDVLTPWTPHPDETYGCSGLVQINSSGIRIVNGKVHIVTDSGTVTITGSGIMAKKNEANFVALNHSGLTIVSSGDEGAFRITSTSSGNELEIKSSGIVARKQGIEVFNLSVSTGDLSIFGGTLRFASDNDPENKTYLEISSAGLIAKKNDVNTIVLDSALAKISIYGGSFDLRTSVLGSSQGIFFDETGLRVVGSSKTTFELHAATGSVRIRDGNIIMGKEDSEGSRLVVDSEGLRLYDTSSIDMDTGVVFRLSSTPVDGASVFLDGSKGGFKISSDTGSIQIDQTGLYGPSFSLSAAGLIIDDGTISCGNVLIDPQGLTIYGGHGLKVYNKDPAKDPGALLIATIDNNGIKILANRGLKIVGGGEIVFEDPLCPGVYKTAISSAGINAAGVTTGTLTITGSESDSNPKIEVKDGNERKVLITRSGIDIFGGALNLEGDNGKTFIQDGYIQADALQIGLGASNFIRNGRADFPIDATSWAYTGVVAIVSSISEAGGISAGRSGSKAFKLSTPSGGNLRQVKQTTDDYPEKLNEIYSFSAWVYLISGSLSITAEQSGTILNNNDDSTPSAYKVTTVNRWTKVRFRFKPTKASGVKAVPMTYKFTGTAGTVAYITDVCSVEGDFSAAYTCHPTELSAASGNVLISDKGIAITNGMVSITSANETLRIDSEGIRHSSFELGDKGLKLSFQNQDITIDDTHGFYMHKDDDNYVKLNIDGLAIKGGLVDIRAAGGNVSITNTGIKATLASDLSRYVELNATDGLKVAGGAVKIESLAGNSGLTLINNRLTVKSDGSDVVELGSCSGGFNGLVIRDGKFKLLPGSSGGDNVEITNEYVKVAHKDDTYSMLNADGLKVYRQGTEVAISGYARNVVSGGPILSEQIVYLPEFQSKPKVLVVPYFFQTQHASHVDRDIFNSTSVNVFKEGQQWAFSARTMLLIKSSIQTALSEASAPLPILLNTSSPCGSTDTWTGRTAYHNATKLTVGVRCVWDNPPSGGGSRPVKGYVTLKFYYFTTNWSLIKTQRKDYYLGYKYSAGSTEVSYFSVSAPPPGFYLRCVVESYKSYTGSETNYFSAEVTSFFYEADITIPPTQPHRMYYLAVDGGS